MNHWTVRDRLIHLHHCRGIGWKTIFKMISADSTLESIYFLTPQELQEKFQISSKLIKIAYSDLHNKNLHKLIFDYKKCGINILTIMDEKYPELLKNTFQPPWVLFYKGNIELIFNKRLIAVVGTRNPTQYGLYATRKLVQELVAKQFVIVSGLAKGIDYTAHLHAISNKGKTIAVLGSGIFNIYPKQHEKLAHEIGEQHLLLSEYPPFAKPEKHHFPERNRIISGLSIGTIVIEAKEKSGSLITAQMALDEGREVFAVPGPIYSDTSKGTNRLIQEGAKLVTCVSDILSEFPDTIMV